MTWLVGGDFNGTKVEMEENCRVDAKDAKENEPTRLARVPDEVLSVGLLISTGALQLRAHNLIK